MKRRVSSAALVAFGLATITGCSEQIEGDDAIAQQFGSDYVGAGGMVNVTEPIAGDAFLAGGRVAIATEVQGDLVVAGGEVSLGGAVGDDLYGAGGNVQLDSIVTGNARLAGGDHLHFSIMLRGTHVVPVEWWDARWRRDHVTAALTSLPLVAPAAPPPAPASGENGAEGQGHS